MIIYNTIIPFKGFSAINLFGVLFVRRGTELTDELLAHERIHTMQQREMLVLFFYLWYVVEWLLKLAVYKDVKKAYMNISFEREAYACACRKNYRHSRRLFAWIHYL